MAPVRNNILPKEKLQQITQAIHTATGIVCAVLTPGGDVVTLSGHQRICAQFHRKHSDARQHCQRHNRSALRRLAESREYLLLHCPHGLVDIAAPIVVDETHVANVFLGQFLLETAKEKTRQRFEQQANQYGFDRTGYLEALESVPVYPEAKIKPLVLCLTHTAELIAKMSMDHARHEQLTATLQDGEKRFRLVADFTYDWEYWIGTDGVFIYVSPSCKRITGHAPEAFLKRSRLFLDIIHPEDRPVVDHRLQHEMKAPGHTRLEFRIVDRSGNIRWIRHICQAVYDDDGRWLGRRAGNRDISERKALETELSRRDAELQEKNNRLGKANQALKSLLDHREAERKAVEADAHRHLQKMVLPFMEKARQTTLNPAAANYLDLAASNLQALLRGSGTDLFDRYRALSPTEIKVAELVRQGQRTKQIAAVLHLATSSVAS